MKLSFSFIIPVYNRPEEIEELLASLVLQTYTEDFETVIIEDGSQQSSEVVIGNYQDQLNITYLKKQNSGPGDSRNYGMTRARGNYFIILDSDCTLPPEYLTTIATALKKEFVHCFGGPDAAHASFSLVQKAINYAMTAVLTTGGIRGGRVAVGKFQPRSFNMGLSKVAFEKTSGYGNIHPGEDPDLTFRLWKKGFDTRLISAAYVYHKRRIDWKKFFKQVYKFGMVRPILNKWHPGTAKITYWFPSMFCLALFFSIVLYFYGITLPLWLFWVYFMVMLLDSLLQNKSLAVALLSLLAVCIQFVGYGYGFLKSTFILIGSKKNPEELFPSLFFKNNRIP